MNSDLLQNLKSYNGDDPFIFISYSHRDSDRVLPIIDRMQRDGYRVWFDEGIEPGTEWDETIANHVINCNYLIAFISENYLNSNNCKDELNYARDQEKDQLLINLENVNLPAGMALRMSRLQNIPWYAYKNPEKFYEKLYEVRVLQKFRDQSVQPTAAKNSKPAFSPISALKPTEPSTPAYTQASQPAATPQPAVNPAPAFTAAPQPAPASAFAPTANQAVESLIKTGSTATVNPTPVQTARPTPAPTQAAEQTARPKPTPTPAMAQTTRPTPTPTPAAKAAPATGTVKPSLKPAAWIFAISIILGLVIMFGFSGDEFSGMEDDAIVIGALLIIVGPIVSLVMSIKARFSKKSRFDTKYEKTMATMAFLIYLSYMCAWFTAGIALIATFILLIVVLVMRSKEKKRIKAETN